MCGIIFEMRFRICYSNVLRFGGHLESNLLTIRAGSCGSKVARLAGFEPAAYGLEVRCSIQLSYRRGAEVGKANTITNLEMSTKNTVLRRVPFGAKIEDRKLKNR